jgi:hypothetical protein
VCVCVCVCLWSSLEHNIRQLIHVCVCERERLVCVCAALYASSPLWSSHEHSVPKLVSVCVCVCGGVCFDSIVPC